MRGIRSSPQSFQIREKIMKSIAILGGVFLAFAISPISLSAFSDLKLSEGEVEVLFNFENPEPGLKASPEGIAMDRNGNIYISLRTNDGTAFVSSKIVRMTCWGEIEILVEMGPSAPGGGGAVGLATDPNGNVYVAFMSMIPESHGVWKVYPDGEKQRLEGSSQIIAPNALAFDKQGDLYVTDSNPMYWMYGGAGVGVWKYEKGTEAFVPWLADDLVRSLGTDPLGNPMVGANGITFVPPDHLYIANTQQSLIAHVFIMNDGSAGETSVAAAGWPVINPDGLAADALGNVYAVIPASTFPTALGVPPLSPVVRLVPETGTVEPVIPIDFPDGDFFDMPTSLAFGTGPWDQKSVFVIGIGLENYFPFPGSGPKLTQVGVGIPGRK